LPGPRWLARFNKRVTNRISMPLAPWLPAFGIVSHVGRRSGRRYRTPINVFRSGDRFVFALTYGPRTEWVRNVLASGGCELQTRQRTYQLTQPRVFHDSRRQAVPPLVRIPLTLLGVADFLELQVVTQPSRPGEPPSSRAMSSA